ncbi:MAG: TrkA C-terminal domain-containing protein, partial [Muribaculaceae bacterium]|nr:TrkA C-terminal domain-containing protein [Muribaculaceae bacterium]
LKYARLNEEYESLLVAVQRGEDDFITPTADLEFRADDVLWIVGDPARLQELK